MMALLMLGAAALAAEPEWIAIGGGSRPDLNQVSLQHDIRLVQDVLGQGGRTLFAGGAGTSGVQVLDPTPRGDPLLHRLGAIFQPRGGRNTHYEDVTLATDGPATRTRVLAELSGALAAGTDPLLVFIGTHGEPAELPADTGVWLWGEELLTAAELTGVLDKSARPVRVVVGACFSGGFAELAFRGADPAGGVTPADRCGLFATTWRRESSGCDPDPDRRAHQGYPIHLLNALRGRDQQGLPLDADLDDDGRVSLLEAHTRARVASPSFDVPTTTSERWLRHAAADLPDTGTVAVSLPEDDLVIRTLSRRLGLDAQRAQAKLDALYQRWEQLDTEVASADEHAAAAYRRLAAAMLGRWPVLDDPYHPDFGPTLTHHRAAIEAFLASAPEVAAFDRADAELQRRAAAFDGVILESAMVERLVRAHENKDLAGRLAAVGGAAWNGFNRLRSCERHVPRRQSPSRPKR